MQNAELTYAQDPGAVTELLSGEFFEPFGRSTSHQLWSSAMVVTPIMRGMFGLEVDGLRHTLRVQPQLPADWNDAALRHVCVGERVVDLTFHRLPNAWVVTIEQKSGPLVRFEGKVGADRLSISTPAPAVDVGLPHVFAVAGIANAFAEGAQRASGAAQP
jgi:hypothetical protein